MALTLKLFHSPLNTLAGETGQIALLDKAVNVKLLFDLDVGHTLSFDLPAQHWATALIIPLVHDVLVYVGASDAPLMRFRIISQQIGYSNDNFSVSLGAVGYKQLTQAWIFHDADATRSIASTPQSLIAWQIFALAQAKEYAALGVLRGAVPAGALDVVRDRIGAVDGGTGVTAPYYDAGKPIYDALQELSHVVGGFEWDLTPHPTDPTRLTFDVWCPRGRADPLTTLPLRTGSTVDSWSATITPDAFANVVRTMGTAKTDSGGASLPAVVAWSPTNQDPISEADLNEEPPGRWEKNFTSDAIDPASVQQAADGNFATAYNRQAAWALTLRRGAWTGPDDLWLGDVVSWNVQVPSLNDDGTPAPHFLLDSEFYFRILKLDLSSDANGNEAVALTVGVVGPTYYAWRNNLERRLRTLELR